MFTDPVPQFIPHDLCSVQQQELESIIQEGRNAKWPLSTEVSSPGLLLDWVQHWGQDSRELILLEAGAKGQMLSSVYEKLYTLESCNSSFASGHSALQCFQKNIECQNIQDQFSSRCIINIHVHNLPKFEISDEMNSVILKMNPVSRTSF